MNRIQMYAHLLCSTSFSRILLLLGFVGLPPHDLELGKKLDAITHWSPPSPVQLIDISCCVDIFYGNVANLDPKIIPNVSAPFITSLMLVLIHVFTLHGLQKIGLFFCRLRLRNKSNQYPLPSASYYCHLNLGTYYFSISLVSSVPILWWFL